MLDNWTARFAVAAIAAVSLLILACWRLLRMPPNLELWLGERGLHVQRMERRWLTRGPFPDVRPAGVKLSGWLVHILVHDGSGTLSSGWVWLPPRWRWTSPDRWRLHLDQDGVSRPSGIGTPLYMSMLTAAAALVLLVIGAIFQQHRGNRAGIHAQPPTAIAATDPDAGERANLDATQRLATLDNSLRAIEDGDLEAPRDRWDPAYVAEWIGPDAGDLFAWVRDGTAWIPYRGALRGSVGVLMDRQGSSLDRALLLAALLKNAGHRVRLAHGELTREQAAERVPGLVWRRSTLFAAPTGPATDLGPGTRAIATRYQLDGAAIEKTLQEQQRALERVLYDLGARVRDQTGRLVSAVANPDTAGDWDQRFDAAVTAARDHWWVQLQQRDEWINLDVLDPSAEPGNALTPAVETPELEALTPNLYHEVTLRVVAERWTPSGALTEERVLEHVLRPSELSGEAIVLQFWPAAWPAQLNPDPDAPFGLRSVALDQHAWTAALLLGRNAVAHGSIRDAGDAPRASPNPWGGLGGAIAAATPPQSSGTHDAPTANQLTAVWIEYEFRVPGNEPRTIRRVVFDLHGPAARSSAPLAMLALTEEQRLTRSLALMTRTEILPVVCDFAPEFVMHLSARSILANRELLRMLASNTFRSEPEALELLRKQPTALSHLYALALARFGSSDSDHSLLVTRPNLFTRHRSLRADGGGIVMEDAIDIVANETDVDLIQKDAFAQKLGQGVRDTNAEALLGSGSVIANTGDAFASSEPWVTISALDDPDMAGLRLSPDATQRIIEDLEHGYVVVAPASPVQKNGKNFMGWWRINRSTGDTLGVDQRGWGTAMAERSMLGEVLLDGASAFAFDYALCQAIPQAANFLRYAGRRIYGDWHPSWTQPTPEAIDALDLANTQQRVCVIQAILMGFLPTLPLVTLRVKYARQINAARGVPTLAMEAGGGLPQAVRGPSPPPGTPPPGLRGPSPPPGTPPPGLRGPSPPPGTPPPGVRGPSPPPGTPPPGRPRVGGSGNPQHRYDPRPMEAGVAPKGEGPFQGDSELREWMKGNPDHPLTSMIGGPDLYHQADQAAAGSYNAARNAGLGHDAARQASYESYFTYLKQGRGNAMFPFMKPMDSGDLAEIATGKGQETLKLSVGMGSLTWSGGNP